MKKEVEQGFVSFKGMGMKVGRDMAEDPNPDLTLTSNFKFLSRSAQLLQEALPHPTPPLLFFF